MTLPSLYRDYKKYLEIEIDPTKGYVDISNMRFLAPASVIPVIFFAKSNKIEEYNTYSEETNDYLKKILGRSECNRNLLPLLDIDLNKSNDERNECLNKLNNDILKLLFPKGNISYASYGGIETFPHIIGEMIMNIRQHSRAERVYSYSQKYPIADCIDVGILDNGITIPGRYEQSRPEFADKNINPYDFESDCEAIFRSLNGISTKEPFKREIRSKQSEKEIFECGNLSFGIKSSIRLITEGLGGSFLIASREGACYLTKGKTKFINSEQNPIEGTFVCMRFEREFLNPEQYEKIRDNHDLIKDEDEKYKLISKKT